MLPCILSAGDGSHLWVLVEPRMSPQIRSVTTFPSSAVAGPSLLLLQ